MVQHARDKQATGYEKAQGLARRAQVVYASNKKTVFWASTLLLIVALPVSTSAIRNQLNDSPDFDGPSAVTEEKAKSRAGAHIHLDTDTDVSVTNQSREQSDIRSDMDVRINGHKVPLSDDGTFNQTIETGGGNANIGINVQNNTSAGEASKEEADSRTRIRIRADSELNTNIKEDIRIEINE